MVRKLALAVSFALGTLSVPVHALGLGELSSKSALNQNFEADITLLSVQPEELDTVRVKLADAEAFARAGVERPFFLSLLKFEPALSAKGKSVIRVTSEFPIREPFLNFLVEVNWPNGRLLREYTVLLDPPTTTMRRPPRVAPAAKAPVVAPAQQRPVVSTAPASAPTTAPTPAISVSDSEYGPVRANETAWSIAKKVRPAGVSMEQMMMALLEANPQAFVNGNINLLRKGQILRLPSVAEIQQLSRQEARNAYRAQQDQWLASRNAKLQSAAEGATADAPAAAAPAETTDQLRIASPRPEGEGEAGAGEGEAAEQAPADLDSRLIMARENAEATRQEAEILRTRVDDLQARLRDMQKLLSLKDDQLAQLQDRVAAEGLAIDITPAAEVGDVPVAVEGEPPATDSTSADQVEAAEVAAPEMAAAETAESAKDATEDTAAMALEGVATEAEQAKEVVDAVAETVATVEGSLGSEGSVVVEEGEPQAEMVIPDLRPDSVEVVTEVQEPGSEQVVVEGAVETVQEAGVAGDGQPAAVPGEVMRTEPTPDLGVPTSGVAEMADSAVTETPAEAAEPESFIPKPLLRMVEQNLVPIAAGGAALLGLIALLFMRGRRKEEVAETVPAEAGAVAAAAAPEELEPEEAETPAVDEPVVDAQVLADLPDSSFFDELSPSEINTLQDETGEVDPVSEADVYIAYGRYQQAEELLRQAMSREPSRLGLKHKLLEVHYATRNAEAFGTLAQEMVDAGQDAADEKAWKRAQGMGRELAPDNPLFERKEGDGSSGLSVAGAAVGVAGAAAQDDSLLLDDLELSELTAEFDTEHSDTVDLEAPSEVSITLDLDDTPEVAEAIEPDLPESISLEDIGSIDFELPEAESADITSRDTDDVMSDSFDLDSMMTAADEVVDEDDSVLSLDSEFSADELQAQLDELSDLSVLDSETEESPRNESEEPGAGMGLVAEDSGSPEDQLDQPLSLDTAFDAEEDEDDVLQLKDVAELDEQPGDEDEVATKLDLARAYVEMGDEDGARSILQEVVVEGNQAQRGDAERLLGQIG